MAIGRSRRAPHPHIGPDATSQQASSRTAPRCGRHRVGGGYPVRISVACTLTMDARGSVLMRSVRVPRWPVSSIWACHPTLASRSGGIILAVHRDLQRAGRVAVALHPGLQAARALGPRDIAEGAFRGTDIEALRALD